MGITVALLAYKEAENLKVLLPQIIENIEKCSKDYEIVVVDTEQPLDNTAEVCDSYDKVRYVNQRAPRFGGAFRTAIEEAEKEYFLIMDSDGSHNPKYIPQIYGKFSKGNYDIVIGSRYTKGGVSNDAFSSQIMSHLLNFCFRIVIGINAKDLSTDYRMYHTEDLKAVELTCENYDVLEEVLLKIKLKKPRHKLKVGEVPISFEKRLYGESKRHLLEFIISYIKTVFKLLCIRVRGK